MSWRGRILNLIEGGVRLDEPLGRHTSFRVGGPADAWVCPGNLSELKKILSFVNLEGLPWAVLGDGSNVIVTDYGFTGVIIRLGEGFESVKLERAGSLAAGAAARINKLLSFTVDRGLSSIEFLAGLPGTLGGALITNAGGKEGEVSETVERILILRSSGEVASLDRENCGFKYRGSSFSDNAIVFGAELAIKEAEPSLLRETVNRLTEYRSRTQPLGNPCAGCIFKNPAGVSAGELIERCRLKGRRRGGAEVSHVHANFIVNRGDASAGDILDLIRDVRDEVYKETKIVLELEVEVIGAGVGKEYD